MDERIGGIGQGVQYGEWEGAASADSADPEHDRLSELFDTSKTVVAIDIQVLEPITEDRFVIKGYCASRQPPTSSFRTRYVRLRAHQRSLVRYSPQRSSEVTFG